jgi:hypothetical protein
LCIGVFGFVHAPLCSVGRGSATAVRTGDAEEWARAARLRAMTAEDPCGMVMRILEGVSGRARVAMRELEGKVEGFAEEVMRHKKAKRKHVSGEKEEVPVEPDAVEFLAMVTGVLVKYCQDEKATRVASRLQELQRRRHAGENLVDFVTEKMNVGLELAKMGTKLDASIVATAVHSQWAVREGLNATLRGAITELNDPEAIIKAVKRTLGEKGLVPTDQDATLLKAKETFVATYSARPGAKFQAQRPGGGGFAGRCFVCGQPGHRAAECRQRKGGVGGLPSGRGGAGFTTHYVAYNLEKVSPTETVVVDTGSPVALGGDADLSALARQVGGRSFVTDCEPAYIKFGPGGQPIRALAKRSIELPTSRGNSVRAEFYILNTRCPPIMGCDVLRDNNITLDLQNNQLVLPHGDTIKTKRGDAQGALMMDF